MKWTFVAACAALAGGIVIAAYRKSQQSVQDATLWSEATDPVVRFGD